MEIYGHASNYRLYPLLPIQATTDPAVFRVALSGVSVMVKRVCTCPQSACKLDSQQLSPVLSALMCFSESDTVSQATMLELVAHCLVHATSSCSQYRPFLKTWAAAAALHSHLPLAQVWSKPLVVNVCLYEDFLHQVHSNYMT